MTLDRLGLRILGVLLEKELATPEHYPLTENSLLAGCNQKSNRDPVMELEPDRLHSGILALQQDGWVGRNARDGGRTARFTHRLGERLGLDRLGRAILAELMLRGPQAPGALLRRIVRMGCQVADADGVEQALIGLRDRSDGALVQRLPRQPRERDARWAHLLGPEGGAEGRGSEPATVMAAPGSSDAAAPPPLTAPIPATIAPGEEAPETSLTALADRVARLEAEVQQLRDQLKRLDP